jgi:hypothetical protein
MRRLRDGGCGVPARGSALAGAAALGRGNGALRGGAWINRKLPHLGGGGQGINRQLPHLGDAGQGINRQLPHLGDAGRGINRQLPHLGDAGRGILAWFAALAARLRKVVVCNGDWQRVVASETVMGLNHLPACGVFLDPPYGPLRTANLYTHDDTGLPSQVRDWCASHGTDSRLRIVLAGYAGDGNETLVERHGWRDLSAIPKRKGAGYGNQSGAQGNGANRQRERLWLSPGCADPDQRQLF